ncbi:MAG: hypothetical protein K2R98_04985 [Gemmataceae bacterium]|nr:hypothetical protein [Gemmataceae bacterium]
MPGTLDVSDLPHLCPGDRDVFSWAEEHLRALTCKPVPTLVPARQANGHCHWLIDGLCAVHEHSPYGCAFFEAHMTDAEGERRAAATIQARRDDAAQNGLYFRVWQHLCRNGLIGRPGDRAGLAEEWALLQRVLGTGGR